MFKGTTAGGIFADRIRKAGEHKPAPEAPPKPAHRHETRLPRESVFVNATLVLPSGKVPAVVTNVNAMGARVAFTANLTLRGDIVLMAPTIGLNSHVRVAWQQSGSAGLIFVKPDPGAG
jgi:hypothetical protein